MVRIGIICDTHGLLYGHAHKPFAEQRQGVLYLNPGSAGPRRFKLALSLALLTIDAGPPSARIVELSL